MEYKIGNTGFFKLVVVLLSRCIVLHILLNYVLFQVTYNSAYANDCYLGISSLGFALNTLSILSSCEKYVIALPYGLTVRVPKYVFSSFDMLFLQLPLPTSSLNGHLAGILAGLSYLKSYSSLLIQNRNHQRVEDLSE
ncbi:unnamed protein product [Trichobilharzia szidati]|nr:unnamed protein product [Trichobilharzia szidati]